MWRIFKGIPRAFRQQFSSVRSAPQSVCHEEEKAEINQYATVLSRSTQQQHQQQEQQGGAEYSEHSTHGQSQDESSEQGHEGGCEWAEWCRSFRNPNHHTAWEAMGWGSAVVLGIQLTHMWPWSKHGERDRNHCLLYRIVHNMPGGTACHMKAGSVCKDPENDQNHDESNLELISDFPDSSDSVIYQDTGWMTSRDTYDVPSFASTVAISYHPAIPSVKKETFPKLHPPLVKPKQNKPDVHVLYEQCEALLKNSKAFKRVQSGEYKEAVDWWKQTTGSEEGHFNLGLAYEKGRGTKRSLLKAAEQYQHASLLGHSRSQYNLGMLYLEGRNGVPQDTAQAIKQFRKAARNGLPQAQTQLGVLYSEQGPKGMKRAASWFQIAARQKDPDAQYYLGICYENGWGVSCDLVKARKWYQLAAKANHLEAKHNLAVFYEKGIGGLEESLSRALELFEEVAETGDIQAQAAVSRLTGKDYITELTLNSTGTSRDSGLSVEFPVIRLDKKRSQSSSSPTLTDYIRQNMAHTDVDFELSDTESNFSNDDSVQFTLGDMDEDTSDFSIEFDPDFDREVSGNKDLDDGLSGLAGLTFESRGGLLSVPDMGHSHLSTIHHSQSAHQLGTLSCK